ncbi:MAG: cysteine desulfurase [Bacteroidia bacterium]|nr:cysteine desulfurase [Bacteroidia bacterium]
MKVYFDNAATTPMDPEVVEAMIPFMKEHFGNPSSIHSFGRQTRAAIENARKTVARFLHVSPGEIFFTSGGTESNNMAIQCAVRDLGVDTIITSPIEHHAVLHTIEVLVEEGKVRVKMLRLDPKGFIDLAHLEELLKEGGKILVSLMHANNEIGNLLPLKKVSELCSKFEAFFHTDTVQTMGHYTFNLNEVPVDFLSCAAHKFHGPKGVGFIYINSRIKVHPFIHGGSQERNMRGGTENLTGIIGLAKAMEVAYGHLNEHQAHVQELKSYMILKLKEQIPGVNFNGDPEGSSLYTVLNVQLPSTPNAEMLIFNLDIAGVACSGGSACTSGSNVGSHVLRGIHSDMNRPSIRFSFSKFNTRDEVDYVVEKLRKSLGVPVESR